MVGKTVLLAAHAGAMRALDFVLTGEDYEEVSDPAMPYENGAIICYRGDGTRCTI